MRIIVPLLIILFSISSVYFYLQTQHLNQKHELALANMQDKLTRTEEKCQARVSQVRSHYQTLLARKEASPTPTGPAAILDILSNMKNNAQASREDIIAQAQTDLGLPQEAFTQFTRILKDYEVRKQKVFNLSKSERKPFFDQRYLDMLKDSRRKTMARLNEIFTSDQMRTFREKGLDQALGMQAPPE